MFRNLKLSMKLSLGFAVVLVISTVVTVIAVWYMDEIANSTEVLYSHPYTVHTSALKIQRDIFSIEQEMKDMVFLGDTSTVQERADVVEQLEEGVYQELALLYERFRGEKTVLDTTKEAFDEWKPIRDEIIRLQRTGRQAEAAELTRQSSEKQLSLIEEAIEEIVDLAQDSALSFYHTARKDADDAQKLVIGLLVLTYIVAITAAYIITKGITRPIGQLVSFSEEISLGNLTVDALDYTSKDEIGMLTKALKEMQAELREITCSVVDSADSVSAASQEMSSAAQETSASVQELASTGNQFAGAVDKMSQDSQEMSELADKTNKLADQGLAEIEEIVNTMEEINGVVTNLAKDIRELDRQSEEIGQIVTLITGIADQTNLLALNAAIEAARAGEQGRGFAVVAEEVRKLAEQSGEAAGEITQLIHRIRESAANSVNQADVGTNKVNEGMEVVTQSGKMFNQINEVIEALVKDIGDIASAGQELAAGAEEMSATTEQQAASVEQIAAAAEQVAKAAEVMHDKMSRFKI